MKIRTLLVALFLIGTLPLTAEPGYRLEISSTEALAGDAVDVEVRYESDSVSVAALTFAIDYDETKLTLDGDGNPELNAPALRTLVPSSFRATTFLFPARNDAEIGFAIFDPEAPIRPLSRGTIARLRFRVKPDASGFAAVRISDTIATSAADSNGEGATRTHSASQLGGISITAARPRLIVAPQQLEFGSAETSKVHTRSLVLVNSGNASVSIDSVTAEGSGFAVEPVGATTLQAGESIPLDVTFTSDETGRFSGFVTVTANGSVTRVPLTASAVRPGTFAYDTRRVIPAVAKLPGANESTWATSLHLHNSGTDEASVKLTFINAAGGPAVQQIVRVAPQQTARYADFLQDLFEHDSAAGAMLIESSSPSVTLRTEIVNTLADGGRVTQAVPSIDWSLLTRSGQTATLVGLEQTSRTRTKIALVNPSDVPLTISARVFAADGTPLGTRDYALGPHQIIQGADLFTALKISEAEGLTTEFTTATPRGAFYVYASSVDATSGAPLFIAPY